MLFRPAKLEDVRLVLPMVDRTAALHRAWDDRKYGFVNDAGKRYENWMKRLTADQRAVFLVAQREQSGLAGFIVGTIEPEIPVYEVKEYGFVHELWVEEPYRHEGVGRQLVMLAIERFGELGVPQVRLDTAMANEAARALFGQCGFRPSCVEMLLDLKTMNP